MRVRSSIPACGICFNVGHRATRPIHDMIVSDHENAMWERLLVGWWVGWFQPPSPPLGLG